MNRDIINKIPKIELHLHLDGSVLRNRACKLSNKSIEEVNSFMVAPTKCENLTEYLTRFDYPISLMQSKENLYNISKDLVDYLESESVIYAEVRFAPIFHTKEDLTLNEVVESVLKGLNSNPNVKVNLILCMMRGVDESLNLSTIEVAKRYLGKGVCALDLAGDECNYPLSEYINLFEILNQNSIPYTIHAGESGPSSEVLKAINIGARRIGHGIHSIDDEDVLNVLKEKNVMLEVCPTSNVQTNAVNSYKEHPIYEFFKNDILVNISTDNMTVSNVTISEEYFKLYETFGFSLMDFEKMNIDSINHAFISNDIKNELISLYEEKVKVLKK